MLRSLARADGRGRTHCEFDCRAAVTRALTLPQNRYHIDPRELIRIQRQGRERGEDMVGFYHSHPDHPHAGRPLIWPKLTGSAVHM